MLPSNVERATRLAALWIQQHVSDWVVVKDEILTELDNETRKLFSRRDERTKEIVALNQMELEIVALWKELTGVELQLLSFKMRRNLRWWRPEVDFEDE